LNENAPGKPVFKSEEIFTKIIIGAALRERDPENRVVVWADTISKARNAILTGGIALPQTVLDSHAQDYAFKAAKALTVGGHSNILARAVDLTTSIGFPALLALTVPSWIFVTPVAPIATQAVRYFSGASLGDHIAKAARSTRQNFRMLANLPPGRIERHLGNITHI
jgi:hypothetical protein